MMKKEYLCSVIKKVGDYVVGNKWVRIWQMTIHNGRTNKPLNGGGEVLAVGSIELLNEMRMMIMCMSRIIGK